MKTVLITGASSGIGKSFCQSFAKRGYRLIMVARHQDQLEQLRKEIIDQYDVEVHILARDLTKGTCREVYEACRNMQIDLLINNAGFGDSGTFLDRDLDKQLNMIRLNIMALVELTHLFGKDMQERDAGGILNVASIAAFAPGPYMSVYYATKSFVLSFSQALAYELKDTQVSVTCLCPGPVQTDFFRRAELLDSPMWKIAPPASPSQVAEKAIAGLMHQQDLVINSLSGKLFNFAVRIVPRKLMLKMVGMTNGQR